MKISVRIYRIIAKLLLAAVVLVFVGTIAFVGMQVSGKNKLYSKSNSTGPDLSLADIPQSPATVEAVSVEDVMGNWQEGDVRYEGVHYRYNDDVLTFLFLGIDKNTEVKAVKNGIDGGQSDAIFLLVLNPHTMEAAIISVPRDTMTEIDVYSKQGIYMGTATAQITLQHGYGDGAQLSCERSMNAVSKLFYNLPIHGYCAINMGAIPLINDAVGGVELVALEDVKGTNIKKDQKVHLKGQDAYKYLQSRDTNANESAVGRLERQKQYLSVYAATAMDAMKKDITLPVTLYNTISKYMVTDISIDEVSYLTTQAGSYSFNNENIYTLQGEVVKGETYEEFYFDETALYELILEVFYEEVIN